MPPMKCPNGACPFLFDPSQVPAGATLQCPRCQFRFQLAESSPVVDPFRGSPLAGDQQATLPISSEILSTPAPLPTSPRGEIAFTDETSSSSERPTQGSWSGRLVVLLIALLAGLGPIVWVLWFRNPANTDTANSPTEIQVEDRNFAWKPPAAPWKKNIDWQTKLGVNIVAYTHAEQANLGFALHTLDYKTRNPLLTELRDEALKILKRGFLYISDDITLADHNWAGQPAKSFLYRGESILTSGTVVGEVRLLAYQGVGYWSVTWVEEAVAKNYDAELTQQLAGFRLLNQRKTWKPEQTALQTFTARLGGERLNLKTYEPIWSLDPEPEKEASEAVLLLRGKLKSQGRGDFTPEATVAVLAIPGEAAKTEEYLKSRWARDPAVFGPTTIVTLEGEPEGEPSGIEQVPAVRPVVRWRVSPGGMNTSRAVEKLVVFSVNSAGGKTFIAEGQSPWAEREAWERRLMNLVGTLAP